MPELLVQGCSETKNDVSGSVPAFDLYSGYFYKIIKKAAREDEYKEELDICIVSAEYGLLDREDRIEPYDREMTRKRAEELQTEVVSDLQERINDGDYERVILNLGKEYRLAVEDFQSGTEAEVTEIEGEIGERGHQLKKIVRGEEEELQT